MLLWVLLAIVAAVAAVLICAAMRPSTFKVERSTLISAPPERIFPQMADLRAFNTWNPFAKADPAARITYRGPESGVGFAYDWAGQKSGAGSMEIVELSAPSRVALDLRFTKPFTANNKVLFSIVPASAGSQVTWRMTGTSPYLHKLIGLFFNMDKMVGGEFAKGLADLKALAEK
jgi:uncharacterized protein YndB with AHSA1/START domain